MQVSSLYTQSSDLVTTALQFPLSWIRVETQLSFLLLKRRPKIPLINNIACECADSICCRSICWSTIAWDVLNHLFKQNPSYPCELLAAVARHSTALGMGITNEWTIITLIALQRALMSHAWIRSFMWHVIHMPSALRLQQLLWPVFLDSSAFQQR